MMMMMMAMMAGTETLTFKVTILTVLSVYIASVRQQSDVVTYILGFNCCVLRLRNNGLRWTAVCSLYHCHIYVLFRYMMANIEKLVKSLEALRIPHVISGNEDFSIK